MKILVGIPCYNCSTQVTRVLNQITHQTWDCDFLIVDNCSTDDTFDRVNDWRKHNSINNFTLLRHQENYGLGGSFKTITHYAKERGYDWIVIFHGDDQATIHDLLQFINLIQGPEDFDCILGARFMKESNLQGYSKIRKWGNKLINVIFSFTLRKKIYDIGSGLNAFQLRKLPASLVASLSDHIAYDLHLLFHFVDNKSDIHFMPIAWKESDQISNAKNIETGILVIKMLIQHLLGKGQSVDRNNERRYEEYKS